MVWPLYFSLTGADSRLTRHAAMQCIEQLSRLVGPSIFKGRLSHDQDMLEAMAPHCGQ